MSLETATESLASYNACLQLSFIDWAVVALYFLFNLGIGLYYKSRAGKSDMDEFFLSGRNIPWWLAGTSMVATTFAAAYAIGCHRHGGQGRNRRQLAVVEHGGQRAADGVFLCAAVAAVSVGRDDRHRVLRNPLCGSKPVMRSLRGFRALYLAIPINCIILGWVNKAMVDIFDT